MGTETLQEVVNEEDKMHGEHIRPHDGDEAGDADAKREELRRRIEAGQARNEERGIGDYAKSAADSATTFAKEHPIAAVAGAIAIGLAIGAVTRPGRRAVRRGSTLAALAGEAALAYAAGLASDAGDLFDNGRDRAVGASDRAGTRARSLSRLARARAANAADEAALSGRSLSRRASRGWRNLR